MAVWTVSAELGTGGDLIAADLAAAAGISLIDRDALALLARDLNPDVTGAGTIDDLERCVGKGGVTLLALGIPFSPLAGDMVRQLQLHRALPELGRAVTAHAARQPCVIAAAGAFAAMAAHPGAVHVRLRAPLECRIARYAREQLVTHRSAEKAVRADDHRKHAWLRSIYHVDIEDPRHYSAVLDTSRLSSERLVETLLALGGVPLVGEALVA
jgi:Cytidylate kinase-like family